MEFHIYTVSHNVVAASILYTNLTVTKALVLDILSKKSFVYT